MLCHAAGERVDFLLTADQPVANYWINVATPSGLNSPAILSYLGAPRPEDDPHMQVGRAGGARG